jgi:hypothetical protein
MADVPRVDLRSAKLIRTLGPLIVQLNLADSVRHKLSPPPLTGMVAAEGRDDR